MQSSTSPTSSWIKRAFSTAFSTTSSTLPMFSQRLLWKYAPQLEQILTWSTRGSSIGLKVSKKQSLQTESKSLSHSLPHFGHVMEFIKPQQETPEFLAQGRNNSNSASCFI